MPASFCAAVPTEVYRSTGLISCTPRTPGIYSVTVSATDGSGAEDNTTFTWTIGNRAATRSWWPLDDNFPGQTCI